MSDCSNATMRDRLPDLLHYRLAPAERAEVRAHVDACAECRAELALLTRVRAAMPAPSVDTPRVVAALPRYRRASMWRRAMDAPQLRIAAAVVLLAGGTAISIEVARRGDEEALTPSPPADTSAVAVVPSPAETGRGATTATVQRTSRGASAELAMGEMLDDLSDSELRALLDVVGKLEAITPTETEVVVPAVSRGGA